MTDFIASIIGMAGIGVILVTVAPLVASTLQGRVLVAAITGGWVGLASYLGAVGALEFAPNHPVPLIGVLIATPLLILTLLVATSANVRAVLMSIPTSWLVGINALRVVGVMFLVLAALGRLGGPFPYFAGAGDILTAVMAVPLARSIGKTATLPARSLARWNTLGALDLVVAVSLAVTSAPGALRIFHAGAGSLAIQYLPYCLVPTVMVPFYLGVHAIVAAQLAAARRADSTVPASA